MKILALLSVLALGAAAVQDPPEPAQPQDPHKWLQQLAGEWTASAEATMIPGLEPMKVEGTESVRSIGGLWIVAEGSAAIGGTSVTSIMTLGYDPQQEVFVGTWIDSMQTHMWHYRGSLDEARKILTLETEGPSFGDPSTTAKYRDAIELKSADHKVLTSSVQGDDGAWTTFMRADYHRKKPQ